MEIRRQQKFSVSDLKPHPKNYRKHLDDQLQHIIASIEINGIYRNIVISSDDYILAGHGVAEACAKMGIKEIPVVKLSIPHDHPKALKVLAGDNEVTKLAEVDDRLLSEILKDIKMEDDLLGTGFDDMMLANLIYVTRSAAEIGDIDEAKEWVGMPDYEHESQEADERVIVITFPNEADRNRYIETTNLVVVNKGNEKTWRTKWPDHSRKDSLSIRFESKDDSDEDYEDGDE